MFPFAPKESRAAYFAVHEFLQSCISDSTPVAISRVSKIDTVIINEEKQTVEIFLNDDFGYIPFREESIASIYADLSMRLRKKYRRFQPKVFTLSQPIEALIPNIYRSDPAEIDPARKLKTIPPKPQITRNLSKPYKITNGLQNRHIALWHSHGWYYEASLDRWEWQRARLFQTIEDLLPMSFVLPYVAPMLENAGASVFLPRERDPQIHEVVVDNDGADSLSYQEWSASDTLGWSTAPIPGFAQPSSIFDDSFKPFEAGTSRHFTSETSKSAEVRWSPEIPQSGEYAVYVSYASTAQNVDDAHYTVNHAGGKTEFRVNQKMGGGTWIYLGTFKFDQGQNSERSSVVLSNESRTTGLNVSADAVRFGGGMGSVTRNGKTGGRPRFVEAARYYLQYAGMPDTLVYQVSEVNDYQDDYKSRGEWVNYLRGAPYGPNKDRETQGLGIPVDLSLAFHTDAGVTRSDTTIGTLLIYSSPGADTLRDFPDGGSRFANRDFADILQTQLVEDIRAKYDPIWSRRPIWDKEYSEAFRPNVPGALLELLSHQNFLDMKFAHDPRFKFDVGRGIYKAMLKFLAFQNDFEPVVQPLPPTHFQATFSRQNQVSLKWRAQADSLESSAVAEKFVVYTRVDSSGFDNGALTNHAEITFDSLDIGKIYSYKVTAVNSGGESFPSEILSVGIADSSQGTVLVINGFDRIAPPAAIETEEYSGFADFWDQGVPYIRDLSYVGRQYDFDKNSPWLDDDAPGHGASHSDKETTIIAGNTFDFPKIHGAAILSAGYSFVSVSDEVVEEGAVGLGDYRIVDFILGEEKETDWPKPGREKQFQTFPQVMQNRLTEYLQNGGNLFVSGSYIGSDLCEGKSDEHPDRFFIENVLKIKFRTNHAANTGGVYQVDSTFSREMLNFTFQTELGPKIYAVEAPDAIEPNDENAKRIFRYSANNTSAGVAYRGKYRVVAFGFPFETILSTRARRSVIKAVLDFLK